MFQDSPAYSIPSQIYKNKDIKDIQLITLQGSRAYGTASENSDYDFFVVSSRGMKDYLRVSDNLYKYSDFSLDGNINVQHFDIRHFLQMVSKSNYMAFACLFSENIYHRDLPLTEKLTNEFPWNWRTLLHQLVRSCKFFLHEFDETKSEKSLNLATHRYLLARYVVQNQRIPRKHNIPRLMNELDLSISCSSMLNWISTFNIDEFQYEVRKELDLDNLFWNILHEQT